MQGEHTSSWQKARESICANARTIVCKVGSAVVTGADGLAYDVLAHLAEELVAIWHMRPGRRLVLVSSGAVAAGRTILRTFRNDEQSPGLSAKQAIAAIGQPQLMHAWNQAFAVHKKATAQVLLTRDDLTSRQRFLNVSNTFAELLDWGVLPIVNENDTVSVQELRFGDNDNLASLLVNLVHADLFVNLTSADGVRAEDPQKNPNAPVLDHIDDIQNLPLERLCGSKTNVGTGGMYSKLRAARRAAQLGVPTLILPGRQKNVLTQAFSPMDLSGTFIAQEEEAVPRRKYWLAYQSEPAGFVVVDAGAANALLHEGRSLLPGGITNVEGTFAKGALIGIRSAHEEIGVGLTNYGAKEIAAIMGLKRHEVAAILGNAHYPDVIHRDNMLLHAVL